MARLQKGEVFGSYTIEGFIASGGMGDVYAASHTVYATPVAIKILHQELHQDQGWRMRFNEEGVIGQQLKHPHVLSTRELVEQDERIGLVMDLVRGAQTLSKLVHREFPSGLGVKDALLLFLGILQGVEYVHLKGVVHGDIKPENVLIEGDPRDPGTWVPKVTDYGTYGIIAHPVYIDGMPAVVASPRYASPEHLRGVDRIEERSDIYSLGLLLHFLLTGQHVSAARNVEEAALTVIKPVTISLLVDQPEALVRVFQQATSFEVGERFPDCRSLALAIREVLDSLGVQLEVHDLDADLATEVMEDRKKLRNEGEDPSASADDLTRPVDTNSGDTVPISREHTKPATEGWDENPVPLDESELRSGETSISLPVPELAPEPEPAEPEPVAEPDAEPEEEARALVEEPEVAPAPPVPVPQPEPAPSVSMATILAAVVALIIGILVAVAVAST